MRSAYQIPDTRYQDSRISFVSSALFLFPIKFWFLNKAKPLNQLFYLLDYCWIMNAAGVIALIVLFASGNALSDGK